MPVGFHSKAKFFITWDIFMLLPLPRSFTYIGSRRPHFS